MDSPHAFAPLTCRCSLTFYFLFLGFMFYKFVFGLCTQACDVDSFSRVRSAHTCRCSLTLFFYLGFMFYKFVFGCARKRGGIHSRVRFAHLPLFIDFYFLFEFLCFINLFLGCARKRAMWIHHVFASLTYRCSLIFIFFIWVFMFYKFVFWVVHASVRWDSPHMFASLTFRCSLLTSFYYFFFYFFN